ncbi:hypothetical protein JCM9140_1409 [Halalkalibacter wakoensis JCM 9140]|uniref:Uncharacterized protein n=1 Tax=Halalkalibacter wakoensis JCM 9140 TaxID=1236970 RepID=W4Q043_9BACI|nr:hypothetical protein JCM9140_1409 [Halalkalibacter wakoensis JCM 9140]
MSCIIPSKSNGTIFPGCTSKSKIISVARRQFVSIDVRAVFVVTFVTINRSLSTTQCKMTTIPSYLAAICRFHSLSKNNATERGRSFVCGYFSIDIRNDFSNKKNERSSMPSDLILSFALFVKATGQRYVFTCVLIICPPACFFTHKNFDCFLSKVNYSISNRRGLTMQQEKH